jgi:hypothetical protein
MQLSLFCSYYLRKNKTFFFGISGSQKVERILLGDTHTHVLMFVQPKKQNDQCDRGNRKYCNDETACRIITSLRRAIKELLKKIFFSDRIMRPVSH